MGKLILTFYNMLLNVSKRTSLRQIVLVSFLLKIFLVLVFSNLTPISDFEWYYRQAKNISLFDGIIRPNGTPTAYWPAGYPIILGLFFFFFSSSVIVGQLFNAVISSVSAVVFYYVCLRVTKKENISLACTLLFAFYPDYLAYSCLISPDPLFIFLVLLAILLFLKFDNYWLSILSGILFGIATMVRPQAIFIPILIIIANCKPKIINKNKIVIYGVFFLTLLVSLVPWTIRNYNTFNKLIFISNNSGVNLFVGNNPNTNGGYSDDVYQYLINYTGIDQKKIDSMNELSLDSLFRKSAINYIVSHPGRTLYIIPFKMYRLFAHVAGFRWINDSMSIRNSGESIIIYSGFIIENEFYYALMFFWILSWLYLIFMKKTSIFSAFENKLPIIIISYFVFIYGVVFVGTLYYNLVIIPFIILSLVQNLVLINGNKDIYIKV